MRTLGLSASVRLQAVRTIAKLAAAPAFRVRVWRGDGIKQAATATAGSADRRDL